MSSPVKQLKKEQITRRQLGKRKKLFFGLLTAGIMSSTPVFGQTNNPISCSVERGVIKYSDGRRTTTLQLDINNILDDPRQIYRNRNFTAILEPDRLVVVIGGQRALAGHTILGDLNGQITMSNSYIIPLHEPRGRIIKEVSLGQNDVLKITVADGGQYIINLNNPFEWIVR